MNKWRSQIALAVNAALLLLAPIAIQAECSPCTTMEMEAELIYWKPCVDGLDYAALVQVDNGTDVDYKRICMDWEPGVRVALGMAQCVCGWDMTLSYTYLKACDSGSVSFAGPDDASGVTSSLIHPDLLPEELFSRAKGEYDLSYHSWDALFSFAVACRECHHFNPFLGIAGLCLEQDLDATFFEAVEGVGGTVRWDSRYWGVGMKAGAEYVYQWNCCLGLFAKGSATLLVGEADSKNKQDFASSAKFDDGSDHCHFLPGYHIAAGLVYEGCYCDRPYALRLGYEFLSWHNVPNHRVFSGSADESGDVSHFSSSDSRTLGFHGLLAGLSVSF